MVLQEGLQIDHPAPLLFQKLLWFLCMERTRERRVRWAAHLCCEPPSPSATPGESHCPHPLETGGSGSGWFWSPRSGDMQNCSALMAGHGAGIACQQSDTTQALCQLNGDALRVYLAKARVEGMEGCLRRRARILLEPINLPQCICLARGEI